MLDTFSFTEGIKRKWILLACVITLIPACLPEPSTEFRDEQSTSEFKWNVPERIPLPIDDEKNPASEEKFQLGRHLFYDRRLSANGKQSCADCHKQELAFTDGKALPEGTTGDILDRNSQTLVNTSYNASYTWANNSLVRLEKQALIPLFGEDPVEQGINDENKKIILGQLASDSNYQLLFQNAFGNADQSVNLDNIVDAIAVFVRGINSFNSPYDAYLEGDKDAISDSAKRGEALFFGERFECFHCHGGYNFSDSTVDSSTTFFEKPFHNTGLFNINGNGDYPKNNTGLMAITNLQSDMGKFRAPTLRNIALTAPYTHDGSVNTLREMLEIYARGGRIIATGDFAGDGRDNPFKDGLITGFDASEQDFRDVINFLESLTDRQLTKNKRFSDPFETE